MAVKRLTLRFDRAFWHRWEACYREAEPEISAYLPAEEYVGVLVENLLEDRIHEYEHEAKIRREQGSQAQGAEGAGPAAANAQGAEQEEKAAGKAAEAPQARGKC